MTKWQAAYAEAKSRGAEAAVFFDEIHRLYVTSFQSTDGIAVCTASECALFLDFRYYEGAGNALKAGLLQDNVQVYPANDGLNKALLEYLTDNGISRVAIDTTVVTVDGLGKLNRLFDGNVGFVHVPGLCAEARKIKTPREIETVQAAQAITDKAFEHILKFIRRGVTEIEVAAELEYFMKRNGADGTAFDTIAVSGRNSSLPHGVPTSDPLSENAFFTMDFGAKYQGYCSDMTRTVVLGKADAEMRRIYNTVLEAQRLAIAKVKAGVPCKEVDAAARDYIYEMGYVGKFGHSTGHSLGLEIHEAPSFSMKSEDVLQSGMIMTVEPGIYIEGFGGVRIEDMVLVTDDGCINLTASPKELIEL